MTDDALEGGKALEKSLKRNETANNAACGLARQATEPAATPALSEDEIIRLNSAIHEPSLGHYEAAPQPPARPSELTQELAEQIYYAMKRKVDGDFIDTIKAGYISKSHSEIVADIAFTRALAIFNQVAPPIIEKAIAQLEARNTGAAGLVEALEWYGEQARLARLIHSEGDSGRHALAGDGGKKARAALAAYRGVK